MEEHAIHSEYIQLNQLLKLLGWAENGAQANAMIDEGLVMVNGIKELRKRNKIYPGMKVQLDDNSIMVIKK
ncbi:MAG: RNA-binding S4 domain-containing protein [Bacteroidetes bacterium]|nr:RNA-binding S4 domain-containing protein [Bacteroidota bacterium]